MDLLLLCEFVFKNHESYSKICILNYSERSLRHDLLIDQETWNLQSKNSNSFIYQTFHYLKMFYGIKLNHFTNNGARKAHQGRKTILRHKLLHSPKFALSFSNDDKWPPPFVSPFSLPFYFYFPPSRNLILIFLQTGVPQLAVSHVGNPFTRSRSR